MSQTPDLHDPLTCETCARFRLRLAAGDPYLNCNCTHDGLEPGDRCDLCSGQRE